MSEREQSMKVWPTQLKTHLFFKEFAPQVLVFWAAEFSQYLEAFPRAVASPAGLNSRYIHRSCSNVIFIKLEGRFTRPWVSETGSKATWWHTCVWRAVLHRGSRASHIAPFCTLGSISSSRISQTPADIFCGKDGSKTATPESVNKSTYADFSFINYVWVIKQAFQSFLKSLLHVDNLSMFTMSASLSRGKCVCAHARMSMHVSPLSVICLEERRSQREPQWAVCDLDKGLFYLWDRLFYRLKAEIGSLEA